MKVQSTFYPHFISKTVDVLHTHTHEHTQKKTDKRWWIGLGRHSNDFQWLRPKKVGWGGKGGVAVSISIELNYLSFMIWKDL